MAVAKIAALLIACGMLAGCEGGGGSSPDDGIGETSPPARVQSIINRLSGKPPRGVQPKDDDLCPEDDE